MGAIIFVDVWLLKRFGLKPNYAEASGTKFYWAPHASGSYFTGLSLFAHALYSVTGI
jgi:hypothetical protein